MYPIYPAPVRNQVTGEPDVSLRGQQVMIVTRGTINPYPIYDSAGDQIAGSLVVVSSTDSTPKVDIDTETPSSVYLDWYHPGSGARGEIVFEEILRDEAKSASSSATESNAAAQGALASAQALDSSRMQLAGVAVAQGAAFWGVWQAGSAPTPPNDGKTHWGLEIV